MFCKNCGHELKDGARFCGKCGTPQDAPSPDLSSNMNPTVGVACQGGAIAAVPKKKHKMLPFIIIGAAVVLIVLVGIIAFVISISKFSVAMVKHGQLPYFSDDMTIDEAFSDSFRNGKWEYDEDEDNNEQYVFYSGYCNTEAGDEIEVKIGFLYDSDVHDNGEFEVFAIELENEYGDEAALTDTDEIEGFFHWIFNGDDFAWRWDNYDYDDVYNDDEIEAEDSKYQKTNSYGIACNGNSDLAIEAANVFADKYGGSGHDWTLTSVDASVTGMEGTYRYSYDWAGYNYTATTNFTITDYGSYRNYQWSGDFVDLFYGN